MKLPRMTLTEAEHDRMNRFRNHVGLWTGYAIILLLAAAALMTVAAFAIRTLAAFA